MTRCRYCGRWIVPWGQQSIRGFCSNFHAHLFLIRTRIEHNQAAQPAAAEESTGPSLILDMEQTESGMRVADRPAQAAMAASAGASSTPGMSSGPAASFSLESGAVKAEDPNPEAEADSSGEPLAMSPEVAEIGDPEPQDSEPEPAITGDYTHGTLPDLFPGDPASYAPVLGPPALRIPSLVGMDFDALPSWAELSRAGLRWRNLTIRGGPGRNRIRRSEIAEIVLEGTVRKDVVGGAPLRVARDAQFTGNIQASRVTVEGSVHGTIHADQVSLRSTAHVEGQIESPHVAVAGGAFVDGLIRTAEAGGHGSGWKGREMS